MTRVAKEAGLKPGVVYKLVKEEGWRSLRRKKVPLISSEGRKKRVLRAQGLLNSLKKGGQAGRIIFFSDEKTFVVDPAFNPQNDRYICFYDDSSEGDESEDDAGDRPDRRSGRYVARSKHPAGAMFLGAVASTGETSPPIWFPQGFRLGSKGYIKALRDTLIPWMKEVALAHGDVPFIFQQDSAPAHRAKKTQEFLKEQGVKFWTPQEWPPNSPDLNPLDYAIWSIVQQGACQERPPSVAVLKRRVSAFWRRIDPVKMRVVCRRFRPRLERCVKAKGSFFD